MKDSMQSKGDGFVASNPSNPKGWPLGVRIYAPMSRDMRLVRLAAKKASTSGYTAALDARGERIEVRVENSATAVGKAVFDLIGGVYGIPVG
jgi:hypothetical protein